MYRFIAHLMVMSAVLGTSNVALADMLLDEPLALANEQPFAQLANIPTAHSGAILAAGQTSWRTDVDIANNFVRDSRGGEKLVLDGESQRYQLGMRRGLSETWEVGVQIPWLSYNGGVTDNFIKGWHKFWGLPDGGRPAYPNRRLNFFYQRNGVTEIDLHRAESGIGDVQFSAAYQWLRNDRNALAWSFTATAPTGSAHKFTGNGGGNLGIALAATRYQLFDLPLTATANIGAMWLPEGDVLAAQQKHAAWFANGEIGWAATQNLRLKIQLDANSALYDSDLITLGGDAVQLLLGGSMRLSSHWLLDAAIGEDIRVDTAPDVTFHLALKAHF